MKTTDNNLKQKKQINPFSGSKKFEQGNNEYQSLNNKDGFYITHNLVGALPQTTGNYNHFFIVRHPLEVLRVSYVHSVAGSDGSDVEIGVERLTGTTASGSGDALLVADFDAKATANTVQTKQGTDLTSDRVLTENDRLGITLTGTPTALEDVCITLYCQYANRGSYY